MHDDTRASNWKMFEKTFCLFISVTKFSPNYIINYHIHTYQNYPEVLRLNSC